MNKNLPKSVKYIFPSSKDWAGVWFLRYRDLHLPLDCIGRKIINNIVLADKIGTIIPKSFTQRTRKTYKSAACDEGIPCIRKETQARMLSLLIISKRNNIWRKQLTKEFCSDSVDPELACIVGPGGDSKLS